MKAKVLFWSWIGGLVAVLGLIAGFGEGTFSFKTDVQVQRHYRALLPAPAVSSLQIVQTAQQLGYWIRIQTGLDVTYLKGQTPCSTCEPSQEDSFFTPPRLYVDGPWFWLHQDEPEWQLHLRPSAQAGQYELIVSPKLPKMTLSDDDLGAIREKLTPFGVLPAGANGLKLEPYLPPVKPEPPEEARLDSVLYGLVLAPDWNRYARERGIELSGLRARVLIELNAPDTQLPETLDVQIEAQSGQLVRAQVFIHQLVQLAQAPAVTFVRLPSRPHPAVPMP
jgi:hypothetical protein